MAWPTRFSSIRPRSWAASSRLALLALACLALGGCGGAKRASAENDRLRAEALDLRDRIALLEKRNAELEAQLLRADAGPEAAADEYLAHVPRVAEISIDRLSHARDDDGDGVADALVLYVRPADGLGRFLQVVGQVSAQVAVLPVEGDAVTIGRVTLGPGDVREAYRSSALGTHYTVTVPITPPADAGTGGCIAQVEFTDAFDGRVLTARRDVGLN